MNRSRQFLLVGIVCILIGWALLIFTPKPIDEQIHLEQATILPFTSGVTGVVSIGPTCPVVRERDESCKDKPFHTNVEVIVLTGQESSFFASVDTDKEGRFKVMLPPGEYTLQAVGGDPFPVCDTKNVTIGPDTVLGIELLCDTGIR